MRQINWWLNELFNDLDDDICSDMIAFDLVMLDQAFCIAFGLEVPDVDIIESRYY